MINDYRNFELDFSQFNFEKYSEKYLICWSMGVYVSNLFIEEFNCFNKKIAIKNFLIFHHQVHEYANAELLVPHFHLG